MRPSWLFFTNSAFSLQCLSSPSKPFSACKSARQLWVTRLTNFSHRPTRLRPPQRSSASPARHLPHNLENYRVYCLNQDTFESAKMLNQMVLQDNRHKLGSMVTLPATIIQCDKCNNKSLNTLQWKRFECNAPKGQNLFPIKSISKLFSNWHRDKNHTVKPGIFVPSRTTEPWIWKEITFRHVGNGFCNLGFLRTSSFCGLVNTLRNWVSKISGKIVRIFNWQ